uniref:Ovule protein n=1 Tax=Caenorhabditis tropicalis TaxID=1561998 RepID=A0A1I7U7C5_9PELO
MLRILVVHNNSIKSELLKDRFQNGSPVGTPWCYYPTASGFTLQSTGTNSFVLSSKTRKYIHRSHHIIMTCHIL